MNDSTHTTSSTPDTTATHAHATAAAKAERRARIIERHELRKIDREIYTEARDLLDPGESDDRLPQEIRDAIRTNRRTDD